jgi:hypothetical protein
MISIKNNIIVINKFIYFTVNFNIIMMIYLIINNELNN